MAKKNKKTDWKAIGISFGITCLILGVVIGLTVWFQNSFFTGVVQWEWNTPEVWIGNGIAFLIMFGIVHHFIKKPKDDDQQETWKG